MQNNLQKQSSEEFVSLDSIWPEIAGAAKFPDDFVANFLNHFIEEALFLRYEEQAKEDESSEDLLKSLDIVRLMLDFRERIKNYTLERAPKGKALKIHKLWEEADRDLYDLDTPIQPMSDEQRVFRVVLQAILDNEIYDETGFNFTEEELEKNRQRRLDDFFTFLCDEKAGLIWQKGEHLNRFLLASFLDGIYPKSNGQYWNFTEEIALKMTEYLRDALAPFIKYNQDTITISLATTPSALDLNILDYLALRAAREEGLKIVLGKDEELHALAKDWSGVKRRRIFIFCDALQYVMRNGLEKWAPNCTTKVLDYLNKHKEQLAIDALLACFRQFPLIRTWESLEQYAIGAKKYDKMVTCVPTCGQPIKIILDWVMNFSPRGQCDMTFNPVDLLSSNMQRLLIKLDEFMSMNTNMEIALRLGVKLGDDAHFLKQWFDLLLSMNSIRNFTRDNRDTPTEGTLTVCRHIDGIGQQLDKMFVESDFNRVFWMLLFLKQESQTDLLVYALERFKIDEHKFSYIAEPFENIEYVLKFFRSKKNEDIFAWAIINHHWQLASYLLNTFFIYWHPAAFPYNYKPFLLEPFKLAGFSVLTMPSISGKPSDDPLLEVAKLMLRLEHKQLSTLLNIRDTKQNDLLMLLVSGLDNALRSYFYAALKILDHIRRVSEDSREEICAILTRKNADGDTLLALTLRYHEGEQLRLMLDQYKASGVTLDPLLVTQDRYGDNPLMATVTKRDKGAMMRMILAECVSDELIGEMLTQQDQNGRNALMLTVCFMAYDCARPLFSALCRQQAIFEIALTQRDKDGLTALMLAMRENSLRWMVQLIKQCQQFGIWSTILTQQTSDDRRLKKVAAKERSAAKSAASVPQEKIGDNLLMWAIRSHADPGISKELRDRQKDIALCCAYRTITEPFLAQDILHRPNPPYLAISIADQTSSFMHLILAHCAINSNLLAKVLTQQDELGNNPLLLAVKAGYERAFRDILKIVKSTKRADLLDAILNQKNRDGDSVESILDQYKKDGKRFGERIERAKNCVKGSDNLHNDDGDGDDNGNSYSASSLVLPTSP